MSDSAPNTDVAEIEVIPEYFNPQATDYPGGFPSIVSERIRKLIGSPSLHLFSGTSVIGDVRVDLTRPEATCNQDVFDFIARNNQQWKWLIADPPYDIARAGVKLKRYASARSIGGTIGYQMTIDRFIQSYIENYLWFDLCSPCPKGFERIKVWVYVSIGFSWYKPRFLTWGRRMGERLEGPAPEG